MRKIAILSSFMEEHHIEKIRTVAQSCGFTADFYADDRIPRERLPTMRCSTVCPVPPFSNT